MVSDAAAAPQPSLSHPVTWCHYNEQLHLFIRAIPSVQFSLLLSSAIDVRGRPMLLLMRLGGRVKRRLCRKYLQLLWTDPLDVTAAAGVRHALLPCRRAEGHHRQGHLRTLPEGRALQKASGGSRQCARLKGLGDQGSRV